MGKYFLKVSWVQARLLSRIFWHVRPADHIFRPIFGQPQISRRITACIFFGWFPAYSG